MTTINKQRFLQELGGLLTFMSEEDRMEALMLYEKMFDDTDNEQALIQSLLSPTRQAVIIARAYDASARRQAADTPSDEPEPTPAFILAILQVYEECVPLPAGEPEPPVEPLPAEETPAAPVPVAERSLPAEPEELSAEPGAEVFVAEEAPAEVVPVEPAAEAVPEEAAEAAEPEPPEEEPEPEEEPVLPEAEAEEGPASEELPAVPAEEEEDLAALLLLTEDEPEEEAVPPAGIERSLFPEEKEPSEKKTKRPKALMLILFILAAAPVTALCIALLLIPAAACLGLAAASIVGSCAGMAAAFGSFTIFADILVVLGASVIVLALGLLFLWLFIWFIGGAIVGLVRSVIQLGESWCFEEVEA